MRQVETSNPAIVQLVGVIDAQSVRPQLRFRMPVCRCPAGGLYRANGQLLLVLSGRQMVQETLDGPPTPFWRRRGYLLEGNPPRFAEVAGGWLHIEVACKDRTIVVDQDQMIQLVVDSQMGKWRAHEVVELPASSF